MPSGHMAVISSTLAFMQAAYLRLYSATRDIKIKTRL